MLSDFLREEFTRNPLRKLLAVFALPVIKAFKRRVDPRRYNGATLIGLKGIVVKSHGSADVLAFQHALQKAYAEAAHGVLERIARRLAAMPVPDASFRAATRDRSSMHSRIAGTGGYLPAQILTNADLAQRIDTDDEWVRTRTGIRQRHIAAPGEQTSDLALVAAQRALAAAKLAPADVDLIIVATTTPDMVFPSTACILQDKLGAKNGPAFDVQAVCSGFVYALVDRRSHGGQRRAREMRWSSAPKSIRAFSTGTTAAPACCSATAPARSCSCRRNGRASWPPICTRTAAIATSCRCPARLPTARSAAGRC